MRSLVLATLLVPSVAAANATQVAVDVHVNVNVETHPGPAPELVAAPQPPPVPTRPLLTGGRLEGGVALEGGRFAIADIEGGQIGVRGSIGYQLGALRLGIEGSLAKFAGSRDLYTADGWWSGWEDHGGEVRRIGATLRYRVVAETELAPGGPAGVIAGYLEAGAGRQRIAWSGGGESARPDYLFGFGLELAGGRHRMGGVDLGVRFVASPAPDRGVACTGACMLATPDRTHDLGVLAQLGVIFGS
jgi:hypothetical protein